MGDFIFSVLIFASGGCVGFILAAFFIVGRREDEPDEFDGGYRASNEPPARTVIWGGRVEERE